MTQSPETEPETRVRRYTRAAPAVLTHFLCVALTTLITVLSRPGTSVFSWHPFLMTLSFSFLMTEAILVFSPHGSPVRQLPHRTKGRIHWALQSLAAGAAALGLAAISYNKHLQGKAHFTSWHGVLGLLTTGAALLQSLAALPLVYTSLAKGWSLARLKRYHAASGLAVHLLGGASLLLGLGSAWFAARVDGAAWYLAALCPTLAAAVVANQVAAAYAAKKRP